MSEFEKLLKRFTLMSVTLILCAAAAAGVSTAAKRTEYNITGKKPAEAREKLPQLAEEFKRIVNF